MGVLVPTFLSSMEAWCLYGLRLGRAGSYCTLYKSLGREWRASFGLASSHAELENCPCFRDHQ